MIPLDVLEELQNAYSAIAGVDRSILHPRDKFQIYLKMDYAYRLLEELEDLSEYEELVKKLREICRKKYIEEVGRRQFKREVHALLDKLLFSASKKSKKWVQAKRAVYMVTIGYIIPVIAAIPAIFLITPQHALDLLPMIFGFILGVFLVGYAVVKYPSKTNLTILYMLGPFAIYTDLVLMTMKKLYFFATMIVSIVLIGIGLYYLLRNRFLFS